ncbi:MAG: hypothetical protein V3U92_15145 [Cellulophaga sp.]
MKTGHMALPKNCRKQYVVAGSLIESVIAISIIAICLLIALKLYISILDSRSLSNDYRVKYQVDKLLSELKVNQNFESEVYDFKTFMINKVVTDFEGKKNIKKVSYVVVNKKDTVTYQYVILKKL